MKKKLEAFWAIVMVEALHCVLLTIGLSWLGFFTHPSGERLVPFRELVWAGTISFWFTGVGQIPLLALAVMAVKAVWNYCADSRALENRRADLDQEAMQRAEKRLAELLPTQEANIDKAYQDGSMSWP
jgi:hypothetical protein